MRSGRAESLLLVGPAACLLAVVTAVPMVHVVWLSLQERTPFRPPAFAGLENYLRLAADERFWNALWNTVYFAVVSVALELVLGLAVALAVARAGRMRSLVYGAILVPWAVPTVVSARMWEWMYNPEIGVLNHLLGARINWLGDPVLALHAAIAMDVWKSTPFVALLLLAGLQGIPRDLYRAAAIDGAGAWIAFRRITLPLLAPVILVATVFRTIDALRVFDAVYVLTGGGPANGTETLSIYAYKVLFQTLDFGYGSTLAVAVLAVTAAATLVYARLLGGGTE
ncbi:MAG TPA: sugar ABC transporter permease [Burkholderiales bacterium]|jgi:multiple sugar transport system permease protein|nr:sugar ABC transporter permease [Burkholderiales bacterium]